MSHIQKIEAIFIDRDGTIGGDHTIHYPGEFKIFPLSKKLIHQLKSDGINVFSFTNQPGISEGKATIHDFTEELTRFGFDDVFICPHSPTEGCRCRKPGIGMLLHAAEKHNLTLENCMVIGDRWSDMLAASSANCKKILVKTGAGLTSLNEHGEKRKDVELDYVAENLADAIDWLYGQFKLDSVDLLENERSVN